MPMIRRCPGIAQRNSAVTGLSAPTRGSNFTAAFDAVFETTGARILHSAVQAPRMNAICERLVGTLRRELLDRVLIAHVRAVLTDYQAHYNTARPHQGIAQRVPNAEDQPPCIMVEGFDARQIHRNLS